MAGVISFSITGESGSMVAATTAAQLATSRLRVSVDEINAAFARANGGGAAAITAGDLKSKSRAISQSMAGIAMTASMLGGGEAAAVVYPVVLLGKELKGLSAAMKLAGISMGAAAASALVASGAVAAVAIAFGKFNEMREAQKAEKESQAAIDWQSNSRKKTLFGLLTAATYGGDMSDEEAKLWRDNYGKRETREGRRHVLNMLGAELGRIGVVPHSEKFKDAQESILRMKRMIEAQNRGPLATAIEEVYQATGDKLKEAFKLATAAGMDWGPLRDSIFEWRDHQIAEVNKEKEKPRKILPGLDLPSWQSIGAMYNPRGIGIDYGRNTADNTRLMLNEQKKTNVLLEKTTTANSFANQ